jgi:thiamine biosynthesis lipoprotein
MKVQRFREEAMATHFEFEFVGDAPMPLTGVAGMCSRELERLESLFSRFRQGSEVDCVNRLRDGESMWISSELAECLAQAMEVEWLSEGYFDSACGAFLDLLRKGDCAAQAPSWEQARMRRQEGCLRLDLEARRILCVRGGLMLDLGGIGKGYALQALSRLLDEEGFGNYRLSSGGSTLFCRGAGPEGAGWLCELRGSLEQRLLPMRDACLSASGADYQPMHLVRKGYPVSSAGRGRVWVRCCHAALADALSTACWLMPDDEVVLMAGRLAEPIEVWREDALGHVVPVVGQFSA